MSPRPLTVAETRHLASLGLFVNEPEPVLICRPCGYALKPFGERVGRHLAEKHNVSKSERRGLNALVASIGLGDPNDVPLRPDGVLQHDALAVVHGYACLHCNFRTTSSDLVSRHLLKIHKWKDSRKSDGWQRNRVHSNVPLQSWSQNGMRGYWIVRTNTPMLAQPTYVDIRDPPTDASTTQRRALLAAAHNSERTLLGACPSSTITTATDSTADLALTTNWMRRTGWAEMFNGARRDLLVWMSQIPSPTASASYHFPLGSEDEATIAKSSSEDEKRLQYLLGAVDDLFDTCEDTIRHTDNSMRCWLRSQDPHRPYKAPFELVGRRATSQAYRRTVKMLLCFCVRLWRLPLGVRLSHCRKSLTVTQSRAIDTLWSDNVWADVDMDTSGRPVMEEDSDEEDETATDNESDSDDEPGEDLDKLLSLQQNTNNTNFEDRPTADQDNFGPVLGNNPPENAVQDLILQLLYFLFTEEYEGGRSGSTLLVYFCGVLGISPDGTVFQRPKNYTKHLSALIYCARLIIMEVLLPWKSHPYAGYPARPRRGQLDRLNEVRREKMCLGSQAPLGELISLRAYGRALSMSDGPSFRVNWSDDGKILRWDEHRLSMAQFRSLADDVLQRSDSAVDDLMYGWNPGCDLSKVRDRMANTSQGYSFVSEPANNLHEAYLNLSQQVSLANLDGLLSANGWVQHKVRRYLESSDTLLKLLLLLVYLTGGQAARGTELMSVEHQNVSSTSRGIYVYSGTMVIVTRHHKSRHATNNEFQVARFLPAAVGRLLYLYLVYIRPFSRMLCRVCLGADNTDSSVLFRPLLRPTDHWGTEKLSKELSRRATHLFGFTLSVRTYRQISIAITEKHIKQIRRPFNRLQDKGPDAPIESALAWQSGHRPLQRATTYGLDGAYPDSLQPALLQVYKWASGEWHDFLQLKSSTLEPPHSHPRQHNPSSQWSMIQRKTNPAQARGTR
ncbi:hypothetical protein CMUS01_15927 [Colletotrichum musicola]|uniref:C2H2-type domain-containing protein n=1 Tax=Colletotrichum musicola TaxID=2175873 RepID=A0A8H6MLD7_9PEZI|nr:hypothetical protein CMUS01_15927 [Colletotrichum musicola]